MIYFLYTSRPQKEPFIRRQEITNELVTLIASYPLYCFTPWVDNLDRSLETGWFLVACILLNILFNVCLLVYQFIYQAYRKCKFWYIRRQKKLNLDKKRKEKLEKE